MELRQLRTILAIADEGSFTAAAARLHLVQSGLSRQVKQLEAELGATLFARGKHGALPTRSGRQAVHLAQEVMRLVDELPVRVHSSRTLGGELRVGSIGGPLGQWMPRVLLRIRDRRPDMLIRVIRAQASKVINGIGSGSIDVGIINHSQIIGQSTGMHQTLLYEEALLLAVPSRSRWSGLSAVSLADLVAEPLILYPPEHGLRQLTDTVFARQGIDPLIVLEAETSTVIRQAICAGIGVSIVTENFARNCNTAHIRFIPIRDRDLRRKVVLVAPSTLDGPNDAVNLFTGAVFDVLASRAVASGRTSP